LRRRRRAPGRRRRGRRRRRDRAGHRRGGGRPLVKVIAWLAGLTTLVTAAAYMIVSLNRWEWNRALFFGLIVLIAEVALATGLVLRKLAQLAPEDGRDPAVSEI